MSARIATLCLLAFFVGACDPSTLSTTPRYAPEILNPKWMAGTVNPASGEFFLIGQQGSIIHSVDGRHWLYSDTPVAGTLGDIATDKRGEIMVAVGDSGTILRSGNAGQDWNRAELIAPEGVNFTQTRLGAVMYYPRDDIWLAAGTQNAIVRSTDEGKSWNLVSYKTADSQLEILALFIEEQSGDILFAAQNGTTGRSSDGGINWDITTHDMRSNGNYIPHITDFHQYKHTLIATADHGRLLISGNGGRDWKLALLPTAGYFTDSAYDPAHDTIVLSTQMGEVAWSDDRGKHWQISKLGVTNWPGTDIPRLSAVIYDQGSQSLLAVGNSGVVARSFDGGVTWRADILQPLFNLSVTSLLHNPNKNQLVISGQGGVIAVADGLTKTRFPSIDWQLIRPGINQYIRDVLHIPHSQIFIAVGQLGGIWRSHDDGKNWRIIPVNYPNPGQPPHLRDIIIDPQTGALVAAGPAGSIVRSTDQGKSWKPVFQGPTDKGEAFTQLLVDKKRQTLLACEVLYRSVYRSSDGGASWSKVASMDTDGRKVWHGAVSDKRDLILMVGQRGAITLSGNGGDNWTSANTPVQQDLYGAYADEGSGTLFAVGENGIVLRSVDGVNWNIVDSGTKSTLRRIVKEPKSGALLAFGQQGVIIRSKDDGRSWTMMETPVSNSELRQAIVEPKTNNLLIVGRDGSILRSTDTGFTWRKLDGHSSQHLRSAAFNPQSGTLVAVGDGLIRLRKL